MGNSEIKRLDTLKYDKEFIVTRLPLVLERIYNLHATLGSACEEETVVGKTQFNKL